MPNILDKQVYPYGRDFQIPTPLLPKNTFVFLGFIWICLSATLNKKTATVVVFSTLIAVFLYADVIPYVKASAFAYNPGKS